MNLVKRLELIFSKPNLPRDVEARKRASVRSIVGATSHGNIRLQWGQYYTQKDVDEKYERLTKTSFLDSQAQ